MASCTRQTREILNTNDRTNSDKSPSRTVWHFLCEAPASLAVQQLQPNMGVLISWSFCSLEPGTGHVQRVYAVRGRANTLTANDHALNRKGHVTRERDDTLTLRTAKAPAAFLEEVSTGLILAVKLLASLLLIVGVGGRAQGRIANRSTSAPKIVAVHHFWGNTY